MAHNTRIYLICNVFSSCPHIIVQDSATLVYSVVDPRMYSIIAAFFLSFSFYFNFFKANKLLKNDILTQICVLGLNELKPICQVRVFNPHTPCNRHTNPQSIYRKNEQVKKCAYEQRVREIKHATFSPLVLSATGGLAREANTFYKDSPPSGTTVTATLYVGYAVICPFHCYTLPSSQSEVQGCHVVTPSGNQQPLTWLTLNHTFRPFNLLSVLLCCIYFSSAIISLLHFYPIFCTVDV